MLRAMGWFSKRSTLGSEALPPPSLHRFAVVDVETTGLYPNSCRVLSVAAIALDEQGRPEREIVSLVDPGCDPGPVHIHGLTRERLTGAPRYADVLPELHELLAGRVLVAHNATFDHGFLAAEAARAGAILPTRQRLCTVALSRRLGLPIPNHRLGTVAAHWRIPQQNAHDAHDDALVTARILTHSLDLAGRLGLPLPVVDCSGNTGARPYPARVVKTPCPWRNPGRLEPGKPLAQGMKMAITGDTRLPREELCDRLTGAGLEVMNSVSRLTAVLVCNDQFSDTTKTARARVEGTPVIDEQTLLLLLDRVQAGSPKDAPAPGKATIAASGPGSLLAPAPTPGPLVGHRVLVLGGTHEEAAAVRAEVISAGGAAAVNLSANVTDLFLLDDGDADPRLARAVAAGVRAHRAPVALGISLPTTTRATPTKGAELAADHEVEADPAGASEDEPGGLVDGSCAEEPSIAVSDPALLSRGAVVDLPPGRVWTVNAAWRADARGDGIEVDIVAFVLDESERVVEDGDFIFYSAPISEDGAIALSVDGDSEQAIRVDLDLLPEHCSRVAIAASLSGGTTFGQLGAVALSVDGELTAAAVSTLDAGTTETVLVLAELYRRGDVWRFRAVGQGYEDGLAALASRYGVVVNS
jgi:DNA polymerase-3 subunit epsilon